MKALSAEERWALTEMASGRSNANAHDPYGARLDAAMPMLIERRCVTWKRWPDDRGTTFSMTELGKLALRVSFLSTSSPN